MIGAMKALVGLAAGAAIVAGSATAAIAAGADPGTYGMGHRYVPTASPYVSYTYVTECRGYSGGAYVWQSKTVMGDETAHGPRYTVTDGDSKLTHRRIGTYYGTWYCLNLAPGA
ncbi:hypothetical protein V5H98_07310 [Georgenia sp. M64]|uniref:hypothetical protein n=1 Tax=Georgenia sp. M64 TaxID=3120520 RepID=UPI0030E1B59E